MQISPRDASVVGLEACHPSCAARAGEDFRSALFIVPGAAGGGIGALTGSGLGNAPPPGRPLLDYHRESSAGEEILELRSRATAPGAQLRVRYSIPRAGYRLRLRIELDAGHPPALGLATAAHFIPAPLPGFAAGFARVRAVRVAAGGEETLEPGTLEAHSAEPGAAQWAGIRNRFWALLAYPDTPLHELQIGSRGENLPLLELRSGRVDSATSSREYALYAGPVSLDAARAAAPPLEAMLYSGLWQWLRGLCFALDWLLELLYGWIGNFGIAIMALALAVKVLMLPLTALAEHWHRQVNRTQSRMQPLIDAIKSRFSGEEQSERILALYREHGVHPLYALKSLAGFLIQIPIFIAAFAMLSESFQLGGVPFLWIEDLTRPDAILALPVRIPFFGEHFNLLPLLMTLITILASIVYRDEALTEPLLRRQRVRLYWMAALFFVLFYTFPAGMVLYWTTSNLLHFLKEQGKHLMRARQVRR